MRKVGIIAVMLAALALPGSAGAIGGPRITGTLTFVDCHGRTLPVTATIAAGKRTVRATGSYSLRVPPGTYTVTATNPTSGPPTAQAAYGVRVGHSAVTVDFFYHLSCPFRR